MDQVRRIFHTNSINNITLDINVPILLDIYKMETAEKTDNLCKNKKNLNLSLQYNEL